MSHGRLMLLCMVAMPMIVTTATGFAFLPSRPSAFRRPSALFVSAIQPDFEIASNREQDYREKDNSMLLARNTAKHTRTLYDVLGASPDAPRAELKRCYVQLARQTHPDAVFGDAAFGMKKELPDFGEIASAWRILGDRRERRKYDRQLKAQAFLEQVEQMAGDVSRYAAPMAIHVFEKWAMPAFLKAASTTIASVTAAAEDLSQTGGDVGSAIQAAIKAGMKAG